MQRKNFKNYTCDEKLCGENDMKELHVGNYKIGLNNWVCERNYTKGFFVWNYIEKTYEIWSVTDKHCGNRYNLIAHVQP